MMAAARRATPELSFVIVARNAAQYLPTLLTNYLEQDYPSSRREMIFVDSMSEDGTRQIAEGFAQAHPDLTVTILDNPKISVTAGWNVALKKAQGDIVVRIDAHVSIPPHFLSDGVRILKEHLKDGVMCVGGPWTTKGAGFWGRAIAGVLSSPFGVGDSPFRHGNREGYVETVPGGLYWRRVFDAVGFFEERFIRSQDNEMHARIRARGWKFYLSPRLRATYYCRSTIPAFLRQSWGNGYWMLKAWRAASLRHLVPMVFVGALIGLGFGGLIWKPLSLGFGLMTLTYAAMALMAAYAADIGIGWWRLVVLPSLFFLLHTSYGLGSWWAWLSSLRKRQGIKKESIPA